jgi:hypothetical protein
VSAKDPFTSQRAEGEGIAQAHGDGASASVEVTQTHLPDRPGCMAKYGTAQVAVFLSIVLAIGFPAILGTASVMSSRSSGVITHATPTLAIYTLAPPNSTPASQMTAAALTSPTGYPHHSAIDMTEDPPPHAEAPDESLPETGDEGAASVPDGSATGLPTPTHGATPSPPPTSSGITLPAPSLLSPHDGAAFSKNDEILLTWQPVGALADNQYYEIVVAYSPQSNPDAIWYDETPWRKDAFWPLSEHRYLLDLSANGAYLWAVRAVQETGG